MSELVDLNELSLPEVYRELTEGGASTRALFLLDREADLGSGGWAEGDVTTAALSIGEQPARTILRAREPMVVSGLAALSDLVAAYAMTGSVRLEPAVQDGERVEAGEVLAPVSGTSAEVLAIERPMLNLLSRLSGVATLASRFVEAARQASASVRVCDTRKTTPGLRHLEKYAARCGGIHLHRIGLHDAVLIKDNHLANKPSESLGEFVRAAAQRARAMRPLRFVMVEVDTLEQFDAVASPENRVDIVLLDNFSPDALREAVARRDDINPRLRLEASGNVNLDTIAGIASTGVDRISCGAVTHQAVSVDIGLDADV